MRTRTRRRTSKGCCRLLPAPPLGSSVGPMRYGPPPSRAAPRLTLVRVLVGGKAAPINPACSHKPATQGGPSLVALAGAREEAEC